MKHPWVLALAAGVLALPFVGAGPMNGDQAVYLDQAVRGAWFERWTHVAYVLLHAGWATSRGSDLLSVAVGTVGVGVVAARSGPAAAFVLAAFLVPAMPFGEVDVLWFVAVVLAAAGGRGVGAFAVAVSPTALAALPWLGVRFGWRSVILPAVCVLSLVVASQGDWLVGRRGLVTSSWSLAPHLQVLPGLVASLVLARRPRFVEVLALSPLLLAPSDVPAGWLGVLAVIHGPPVERGLPRWLRGTVAAGLVGSALWMLVSTSLRVREETQRIEELAARVSDADEVRGPWSWRVRLALQATGEVDGFRGTGARIVELPSGEVYERRDTVDP